MKLIEFVKACEELGVTNITLDTTGLGLAISDSLKEKGIIVKDKRIKFNHITQVGATRYCRRCGHKIIMRKGKYAHDNRPYDIRCRCRICITEGQYCRIARK